MLSVAVCDKGGGSRLSVRTFQLDCLTIVVSSDTQCLLELNFFL